MKKNLCFIIFILLISGCSRVEPTVNSTKQVEIPKEVNISAQEVQKDVYQDDLDETVQKSSDNLFFFDKNILETDYSGSFYSLEEEPLKRDVKLYINSIEKLKLGELYELNIEFVENVAETRLKLGYFYVQKDKIYKLDAIEENLNYLKENDELPEDADLVCSDVEVKDPLGEDEEGFHYSIVADEDKREYHFYNSLTETGYYETFVWLKNKGLIQYRSGYGIGRDAIELNMKGIDYVESEY